MRHTFIYTFLASLYVLPNLLHANALQLSSAVHLRCAADSLSVNVIPYRAMTDSGTGCVWDFSQPPQLSEELCVNYYHYKPGDSTYVGKHFCRTNRYYHIVGDTIFSLGYENHLASVHYDSPKKHMVFPFCFGDSFNIAFSGTGEYSHCTPFSVAGTSRVCADATGKLLLPNMTTDSVLRVHTQQCYRTTVQDTSFVLIDLYQWYSSQCPYPLLETIRARTGTTTDSTGFTMAFYYEPPKEAIPSASLFVSDTPTEDFADAKTDTTTIVTDVTFLPNPVYHQLHIRYTMLQDAHTFFSVHYNGGTCFYQSVPQLQTAGTYHETIDMTGFPTGTYILYIHANDMILAESIIKL